MTQTIILATDSAEPSGLGQHMLTLGTALAATHDVVLAMPDHEAGRALLRRAAAEGLGVKLLDLDQPQQLRAWFASRPDALLHVHAGIGWEGHDLVRLGKGAGLAVVRTEHLPYLLTDPVQQAAYRAMLLSVDGRIAVSQTVHDGFKHHGKARMTIVHNGITLRPATRSREDTRRDLGIGESTRLLLTVARMSPQKGHSVLIEAAPAVIERFPDTKFVLVGDGPETFAIEALIGRASLSEQFVLLGRRDDVPDLLAAADLFVLPSLFEGLPIALLEANAAGLPAVVSTAGGSMEAMGADHPFIAPCGNAQKLADTIIAALSDPEHAKSAATAAQTRFRQRFSASRMVDETAAFYQSILHRRDIQGLTS